MKKPDISGQAYLAKDAVVCGDVTVDRDCGIWFHTVIRGEAAHVEIGRESNIQDNCVIHVDAGFDAVIGEGVTVGHGAILHGCQIGDHTLIGMGSIVLNGARIGRDCMIGAGSLVTQNTVIPDGSLAFGNPARVKRMLTPEESAMNAASAQAYVAEAVEYTQAGYFLTGADYEKR